MSDAYNFGGNTPGMGTADPNLLARLWGYVHPQAPPGAGAQTGPAGPTTSSGGIVSAVSPPAVTPPIGGGPGNAMEAPTGTPAAPAAIPPTATASVPQSAGGSPFVQLDYRPNADVAGVLVARRSASDVGARPVASVWRRMFAPAAAAAQRINAIPPSATASVPPNVMGKAPLTMGPQRKGMGWPTQPDWGTYKRRPPPDADF